MATAQSRRKRIPPTVPVEVVSAPYTPPWWLETLEKALADRAPHIQTCENYYQGKHRLQFATSKFREAFGHLFGRFSDNWCDLIVDASVERISVQGFRFAEEDIDGDSAAWEMWQANGLDADSVIAHTTAVATGTAYVMVGPGEPHPEITVEHPLEVIVAVQPGNRRKRQAALKKWLDDDGYWRAIVYLPDGIFRFVSDKAVTDRGATVKWKDDDGPDGFTVNQLGVVPVIPLLNDPNARGIGSSDLYDVIPCQDAVNKLLSDMLVASEFGAFRQRYATGLEVPDDPMGQKLISDFASGASRMWAIADPDVKLGDFAESDLKNYVAGVETLIQHIAARTRTPPHYLLGQSGRFPSGESLKATETGLVAKVRKKHLFFGESWESAMRMAFELAGDTQRGSAMSAETLWKDPESRSEGELVDALTKMATLGVPHEFLWQRWGLTPQQIARIKQMQVEAAFTQALMTPAGLGLQPGQVAPAGPTGADPHANTTAAVPAGIGAAVPSA